MKIVGLVPAAGLGSRLDPIPCSKELFPVGVGAHPVHGAPHPKVVSQYLLEHMQRAGAEAVYLILRNGKWDIPAYFGDGSQLGLQLAYLLMQHPYGAPFTLDQAFNFVQDKQVVFGFPDILVEPENAFTQLLARQQQTQADVVLGTFKVEFTNKWDMVAISDTGAVTQILHKPAQTALRYGWAIACWQPSFTQFMHTYLQQLLQEINSTDTTFELSLGEVMQSAIHSGMSVQSVCFDEGTCLDVGTPEDLLKAMQKSFCP